MPHVVGALAVHLLTASGAGLALAAVVAATQASWQIVFLCLGIAFIVDGIDGPLARRLQVRQRLKWFDGSAVDFVVDYTNYVFVPAYILVASGLLREPLATICGFAVAVSGALYFGDTRMKTSESGFRGFPVVWNAVVYLLMIYQPSEFATAGIVAVFVLLTFLPVEFVHPLRVVRWRPLTLIVTGLWAVLAFLALVSDLRPEPAVAVTFLVASFYLAVIGLVLQLTQRP